MSDSETQHVQTHHVRFSLSHRVFGRCLLACPQLGFPVSSVGLILSVPTGATEKAQWARVTSWGQV